MDGCASGMGVHSAGWGMGASGEMCGGACHMCADFRQHLYWEHMGEEKKKFLVVALKGYRDKLPIPYEVGGHLRDMIYDSDSIKLEAPNDRVYTIEVMKHFGTVILGSTWKDFAKEHHIEENDSILFIYRGNLTFKVHLFNSAGHEKFLSCPQPPFGMPRAVPPLVPCDHHVPNENVAPNSEHVTTTDFGYTMPYGGSLPRAQDENIRKIAQTMRSETPLCVVEMRKSNVRLINCYVYLPLTLLSAFKEEIIKADVQLEAPDNDVYSVEAKYLSGQIFIKRGWNAFVTSVRIQEKDLLIFRSTGRTRLQVLILDPSGCHKTSSMCAHPPPRQVIDLTNSDADDILIEGTRAQEKVARICAKTRKIASTSSPSAKSGSDEPTGSNNFMLPSPPYILTKKAACALTMQEKEKVDEKVQGIRSEIPIFVKVMSTSCLQSNMAFCTDYASVYLPEVGDLRPLFLEVAPCHWRTMMNNSKNSRAIGKGWKDFAADNRLEEGDICLFELTEKSTERLNMRVHMIRRSEIEV